MRFYVSCFSFSCLISHHISKHDATNEDDQFIAENIRPETQSWPVPMKTPASAFTEMPKAF